MRSHYQWLAVIIVLVIFCAWVAIPGNEGIAIDTDDDGEPNIQLTVSESQGLDLVGGLRVLLEADIPPENFTTEDLRETANSVGRRVNALGLSEATVQVQGRSRILVELPGVSDPEQAIDTIQQTALLEFVDFGGLTAQAQNYEGQRILTTEQEQLRSLRGEELTGEAAERLRHPSTGAPFETVMTGAGLARASAQFGQTSQSGVNQWFIAFEIRPEFVQTFANFTGSRVGEPMAIVLDGEVLSAPVIQSQLSDSGIITGDFSQEEAETLALQLRAGALSIPLSVESTALVGATLGQESVELSVRAGIIGVIIVLAFMALYYRVPGISADFALIVFILLNIALYKLIPVTLTLPAITGFLIGIGTAVDGNILIFERIKEELRDGRDLDQALDLGFNRAWASIRDSNLSTIIICGILFFFGQTPGASIVSGFAITLGLSLVLNLFTAIVVTRTFLYIIVHFTKQSLQQRRWLLGA
jgi:protein-export membrane protein SecD